MPGIKVRLLLVATSFTGTPSRIAEREQPFYPLIVDCVVQDALKCEFAKAKIPDAQWLALEIGLSQLPDKTQPGIYDVVLPAELAAAL